MKNNPFSLDFGAEPNLYIPRLNEQAKIINTFNSDIPVSHIYLILGVRGSGKTVLMTSVSHTLSDLPKWIHIDLNVEKDMLNSLAANLFRLTKNKFPKFNLSLSFKGVDVSVSRESKYSDVQSDIDEMLQELAKHNIKVLITVDEVINSKNVREFTSYFQHCLREKLPIFVLMTGLYKNIRALQNNRSQTFLKRASKIVLGPLNLRRIAKYYEDTFNISEVQAFDIADQTMGYSFAFQILGYHLFENNKTKIDDDILYDYKLSLEESSYEKIWEELSSTEQEVLIAIAKSDDDVRVKTVRDSLEMGSNNFSTYQNTLENIGILSQKSSYGKVNFSLPYFREFVLRQRL